MKQLCLTILLLVSVVCAHATWDIAIHPISYQGISLHLVSYQNTDASLAQPFPDVLLVHGLTYSSHQFDLNVQDYSLARALANKGFRVWLLDIAGYGQSEKPKDGFIVNSDYAAQDINAAADYIIHKNKVEKINVLGWSWGTVTTSRFVVKHPNKVNKLVLFAPIIHSMGIPVPTKSYEPYTRQAAQSDFQKDSSITDQAVLSTYLQQTQQYDGAGSPNGGRRDFSQPKNVEMIPYKQFKIPVLFIAGDRDPYLSTKKDFELLMQNAPAHSRAIIMPNAGHAAFLEIPAHQTFQHEVVNFLSTSSIINATQHGGF